MIGSILFYDYLNKKESCFREYSGFSDYVEYLNNLSASHYIRI